jgi:hypothetical protein
MQSELILQLDSDRHTIHVAVSLTQILIDENACECIRNKTEQDGCALTEIVLPG